MFETLKERFLSTQLGAAFVGMQPAQRATVLGGGLLTVVALASMAWWASRPDYVVLASQIDYAESAQIAEALRAAGVRVQLSSGGTEVRVVESQFAQAKVVLSKVDLPRSGVREGLEIFGAPNWGWTDFSEKVNYRRALEGELEASIKRMAGVRAAQVHITLSESHPFRRSEQGAAASVSLELRPGVVLSREAVQSIKYLVSSSVERLSSDQVTVLDTQGNVLSPPAPDGPLALADRRMELQRGIERESAEKIRALLSDVVGAGNVRVQVAATLDFDRVVRHSEAYSPDGQVILSQQTSEVAPGQGVQPLAPGSNTATTNYQNPIAVESIEKASGTLVRLSVAVLLNEQAGATGGGGKDTGTRIDLARIEDLVRGAIGYNEARGDMVVVRTAPFDAPPAAVEERDWVALASPYTRIGIGILGLLLIFLYGSRFHRLLRAPARPDTGVMNDGVSTAAEAEAVIEEAIVLPPPVEPTPQQKVYFSWVQEARSRGGQRPDAVVRVLRTWLNEG